MPSSQYRGLWMPRAKENLSACLVFACPGLEYGHVNKYLTISICTDSVTPRLCSPYCLVCKLRAFHFFYWCARWVDCKMITVCSVSRNKILTSKVVVLLIIYSQWSKILCRWLTREYISFRVFLICPYCQSILRTKLLTYWGHGKTYSRNPFFFVRWLWVVICITCSSYSRGKGFVYLLGIMQSQNPSEQRGRWGEKMLYIAET
jgi:hypothetical protein